MASDKDHFRYGINQWTGEPNKPVFYTDEMKKRIWEIQIGRAHV